MKKAFESFQMSTSIFNRLYWIVSARLKRRVCIRLKKKNKNWKITSVFIVTFLINDLLKEQMFFSSLKSGQLDEFEVFLL